MRPFGCGWFIREFLLGHGPFGSPIIDPHIGAPQADVFYYYKQSLIQTYAEDAVAREMEKRARRRLPAYSVGEMIERTQYHLLRFPYKRTGCRYHSFVVYFSNLKRLGWVSRSGYEEISAFQQNYRAGHPRRYYRLTDAGIAAPEEAWANPHSVLYG